MKRMRVTKTWFTKDAVGVLEPTEEAIAAAGSYVFERWKERAAEYGNDEPADLSSSCKFSSMFVRIVFGGRIRGNYEHQYNVIGGEILDLNAEAADVKEMADPYRDDRVFLGSPGHLDSMASCLDRVERWVDGFLSEYQPVSTALPNL